jgi:hypothetical protein
MWTLHAHPTTLFKKKFPPTLLLYLCYEFFFKALFLSIIIVNATIVQSLIVIVDVQRKTKNCHNFMVWATRGAIFFKKTPKQGLSSTIFFALVVSLHFQFGFSFMRSLLWLLSKFINIQTELGGVIMFAKAIVVGGQDRSYLLECKYIFLLGLPFFISYRKRRWA